jgi:hypothetical protein
MPAIDGGMNTSIAGIRIMIGMTMIMITTAITGESYCKAVGFTADVKRSS